VELQKPTLFWYILAQFGNKINAFKSVPLKLQMYPHRTLWRYTNVVLLLLLL